MLPAPFAIIGDTKSKSSSCHVGALHYPLYLMFIFSCRPHDNPAEWSYYPHLSGKDTETPRTSKFSQGHQLVSAEILDPAPELRTPLSPTGLDPKQMADQPVRAVASTADFRNGLRVS